MLRGLSGESGSNPTGTLMKFIRFFLIEYKISISLWRRQEKLKLVTEKLKLVTEKCKLANLVSPRRFEKLENSGRKQTKM